jgi:hypothetical protein
MTGAYDHFLVKPRLFKSKTVLILKPDFNKYNLTTGGAAMKQNIHNVERVIRVVLGLIIFSLVFVGPKSLWGLIGILPIITGLIGWCPPYQLLGISTCKK